MDAGGLLRRTGGSTVEWGGGRRRPQVTRHACVALFLSGAAQREGSSKYMTSFLSSADFTNSSVAKGFSNYKAKVSYSQPEERVDYRWIVLLCVWRHVDEVLM